MEITLSNANLAIFQLSDFLYLCLHHFLSSNALGILKKNMQMVDNNSFCLGLLPNGVPSSTPPSSPSRILKENDDQWLNSEVADFSLSSFLGHLESPMKASQSHSTDLSHDVSSNQN